MVNFPVIFALTVFSLTGMAFAEELFESWSDPNFAFCEGIGAGASGRVNGHIEFDRNSNSLSMKSFSVVTSGHQFDHIAAGSIIIERPDGQPQTIVLQQPWFDVMGSAGPGDSLYLPRAVSGTNGAGRLGQQIFEMRQGSEVKISLNLLFVANGGNCPTSFDATWTIN